MTTPIYDVAKTFATHDWQVLMVEEVSQFHQSVVGLNGYPKVL